MGSLSGVERSIALLAAVTIVAAALTRWIRDHARRKSWLDRPNDRSAHAVPTPRLGGLAIMLAFVSGSAVVMLASEAPTGLVVLVLATAVVASLGLIDDLRPLSPRLRILVQAGAAGAVLLVAGNQVPCAWTLLGEWLPAWVLYPLSMVWVLWLTNLYNFMDGIDGLAGGQAVVACGVVSAAGVAGGAHVWALVVAALGASALGFLRYNFPPASIFMGDVGSTAIGFFLGALPFIAPPATVSVEFVGLAVGLFLLDATVTLLRRLARGENLSQAHRSHFYQRPLACGVGHRHITLAAYLGMLILGVLAHAYRAETGWARLRPVLGAVGVFLLAVGIVLLVERRQRRRSS